MPAYQDYTIRSKESELILVASAARTAITEKLQADRDSATMGVGTSITTFGKVSAASVAATAVVTVEGSSASTSVGTAATVTLTPSVNTAAGTLTWSCSGTPTRFVPGSCR